MNYQNYRVLAINPVTEEPIEAFNQTFTKQEIEDIIFVKTPKNTSFETAKRLQEQLQKELGKLTKKRIIVVQEGIEICVGVVGDDYARS